MLDLGETGEVVGREHFALDDGKVDLDLIEPGGSCRRAGSSQASALISTTTWVKLKL
jgi:hypothetical protein